eukprot:1402546-Amphidinium_carterae.1
MQHGQWRFFEAARQLQAAAPLCSPGQIDAYIAFIVILQVAAKTSIQWKTKALHKSPNKDNSHTFNLFILSGLLVNVRCDL